MSKQLLKTLNGNKKGEFKKFIDSFEQELRIAWYPSAGTDFRALFYLHPNYAKINPTNNTEPESPDIFLFTDYYTYEPSSFFDTTKIYNFGNTTVKIESFEELSTLNIPLHHNRIILCLPENENKNKVVFLKIRINSKELGEYTYPVLYAFAENEAFCAEILIPNNTILSHIIHVRYGGGCGGGGYATGVWILNVLKKLNCEIFITDNHKLFWQVGDYAAVEFYPVLGPIDTIGEVGWHLTIRNDNNTEWETYRSIRLIPSVDWSGYGDVYWYFIFDKNDLSKFGTRYIAF